MKKHYYLKINRMQFRQLKFISADPEDPNFALLESYSIPGRIERAAFKDLFKKLPVYLKENGKPEKPNKQPSII